MVAALEQQYDTVISGRGEPGGLEPWAGELPSADELAAEVEAVPGRARRPRTGATTPARTRPADRIVVDPRSGPGPSPTRITRSSTAGCSGSRR